LRNGRQAPPMGQQADPSERRLLVQHEGVGRAQPPAPNVAPRRSAAARGWAARFNSGKATG
jgi:hypothetical protein